MNAVPVFLHPPPAMYLPGPPGEFFHFRICFSQGIRAHSQRVSQDPEFSP